MVRFSYVQTPDYPLSDSIDMIKTADDLGFYACYSVDEIYHKDMWLLFAAAADKTRNIRMGPNVTHVILRDPTLIAQQLATLDELTGGRAEAVVSFGNLVMLSQYHVEWKGSRPLARVKEGMEVIRTLLDTGKIDHQGEFFKYTGLFTAARPVQERVPLKLGAMGGPRSFELAGEIADGMHHALGYSKENYEYVVEHVTKGAEKAGRDVADLDLGAWIISVVANDRKLAKEAARIIVAFYIPSMPQSQVERHGIEYASLQPIFDAFASGDVAKAIELTTPELVDKLSVAGTPEEVVHQLKTDILSTGINHVIAALVDPVLVKFFSGQTVDVPDVKSQLKLIADKVMPELLTEVDAVTRIPDVEGSDLVPRDPDVLSIGDRAAAEAATRKLAEGYEDRAWGCMSSRHKFCREPCPVYQVTRNEQHTSYGFHATVAAMSQGLVDLEDAYEQYAYCTQCGACELRCPNTLFTGDFYRNRTQLVQLVKAVRAAGVEAGIERGSWKRWNEDTVTFRNEMQGDPAQVAGWADDLDLPRGGETILFCDCMAAYRQTKVPRAVSLLLREAGVEVGLMNDQWCCGGPALEMGYTDIYEQFARHNLEDWRKAGAKRVVTLDPHDYITFVEDYPRLFGDYGIEVLHITDFLAELIEQGKLRLERPIPVSVTYHDPCRLNKRRGIWESPRKILRAIPGLDFRDVDHVTQWAMCSGAGGGLPVALPDVAEKVARNRLEAAAPIGADVLASACVWAEDHLERVAAADGQMPVVDITVLAAMSAGLLEAEPWLAEVGRNREANP